MHSSPECERVGGCVWALSLMCTFVTGYTDARHALTLDTRLCLLFCVSLVTCQGLCTSKDGQLLDWEARYLLTPSGHASSDVQTHALRLSQ